MIDTPVAGHADSVYFLRSGRLLVVNGHAKRDVDPPLSLSLLVQLPILGSRQPHWKGKVLEDPVRKAREEQCWVTGRLPG